MRVKSSRKLATVVTTRVITIDSDDHDANVVGHMVGQRW
jgi:hypothetical protein